MRLGIDLDDTVFETYYQVTKCISKEYGYDLEFLYEKKYSYEDFFKLIPDYNDFFKKYAKNYLIEAPIKKEALKYLKLLHDEGHTLIFITKRNHDEHDDPYELCEKQLNKNEIPYDMIITDAFDKGSVAKELKIDLFIDDSICNCISVKEVGINILLMDAIFNDSNKELKRVFSWSEVYDYIKKEVR